MDADARARLLEALRAGVDRTSAAHLAGIDPSTLSGDDLRSDVEAAEAAAKATVAVAMAKASKAGDWRAGEALLDRSARRLTASELSQRRLAAIKHGAYSTTALKGVGRAQKRRFLAQQGLQLRDLDGIAREYLDIWARAKAKVVLLDQHGQLYGWVNEAGDLPGFAAYYTSALNTAARTMEKLAAYLKARREEAGDTQLDEWRPRAVS